VEKIYLGFSKKDFIFLVFIFGFVIVYTIFNLQDSYRKARDAQRKSDIRAIYDGLMAYNHDFSRFPQAIDGKIAACDPKEIAENVIEYGPCFWGEDSLRDAMDPNYPAYVKNLPRDPNWEDGATYVYFSDGKHFQVYAALEGVDEDEYDPEIVALNLDCGIRTCNFGRSDGKTPLDKSIEAYNNEIDAQNKK